MPRNWIDRPDNSTVAHVVEACFWNQAFIAKPGVETRGVKNRTQPVSLVSFSACLCGDGTWETFLGELIRESGLLAGLTL